MKIGAVVDWDQIVMPIWRASAEHTGHYNRDVWGRLPEGMCWFRCRIEPQDIAGCHVIGAEDWRDTFGSYRLADVVESYAGVDDGERHKSHIETMRKSLDKGWDAGQLIFVASDGAGPFVLIDGNHRAVALQLQGLLAGQECFVGFHHRLADDFVWYWRALGLRPGE
jgi:hypothetical protein